MNTPSKQDAFRSAGRIGLPAVMALALMAGCASTPAPVAQMAVSSADVARAARTGAGEAAPVEMQSAREKLDRAKVAMTEKKYRLARSLAQEAQVDAQLAEVKSGSSKAGKAADELRESIRVLQEELDRNSNPSSTSGD